MIVAIFHASSDVFAKQWHDAQVPVPYGDIDIKNMDGDFFNRIGGRSISKVVANFLVPASLTKTATSFFDRFKKASPNYSACTAFFLTMRCFST